MSSIKTDNNLFLPKNQLVSSDNIGRENIQKLSEDWILMNVNDFSVVGANILGLNFDGRSYFQVGDRIRILNSGVYKFFYVVDVLEGFIRLVGSGSVSGGSIDNIALSRTVAPFGMGVGFSFEPSIGADVGSVEYSSRYGFYSIVGNLCSLYIDILDIVLSTSSVVEIQIELPFSLRYFNPVNGVTRSARTSLKHPILMDTTVGSEYFLNCSISTDSMSGYGSTLLIHTLSLGSYGVTSFNLEGISLSFPFEFVNS